MDVAVDDLPPGLVIVMATSSPIVGCASELMK